MSGLQATYRTWLPVHMADGSVQIVAKPLPLPGRERRYVPIGTISEPDADSGDCTATVTVVGATAAKLVAGLPALDGDAPFGVDSSHRFESEFSGAVGDVARRVDQFLTWLLDWPSEDPESRAGSESKSATIQVTKTKGGWRSSFRRPDKDTEQA